MTNIRPDRSRLSRKWPESSRSSRLYFPSWIWIILIYWYLLNFELFSSCFDIVLNFHCISINDFVYLLNWLIISLYYWFIVFCLRQLENMSRFVVTFRMLNKRNSVARSVSLSHSCKKKKKIVTSVFWMDQCHRLAIQITFTLFEASTCDCKIQTKFRTSVNYFLCAFQMANLGSRSLVTCIVVACSWCNNVFECSLIDCLFNINLMNVTV